MPKKTKQEIRELYETITATEVYNGSNVRFLLSIDTKHPDYPKDGDFNEKFISTQEQNKLNLLIHGGLDSYNKTQSKAKYNKKDDTYTREVVFKRKVYILGDSSINYGRFYAKGPSIQQMWKFCRVALSNSRVVGFDLSNSQPRILNQLCKKYITNKKFNYLDGYVRNRDSQKQVVAKHYNCTERIAKDLFIRLCFGGGIQKWKKDWGITKEKDPALVIGFMKDMKEIREIYADKFPNYETVKEIYDARKLNGDFDKDEYHDEYRKKIAMYLQNIEGNIIHYWVKEVLPDLNVETTTPIHDEINVLNTEYVANNKEDIMCKLQQATKDKFDFDVVLKEESYTLNDEHIKMFEDHKQFVKEYDADDDDDYIIKKKEFEKTCFKINNTSEFAYIDTVCNLIIMNKGNFTIRWEELTFLKKKFINNHWVEVDESFVKTWFYDKDKRVYDIYDFLPPPLDCPDYVYNMWKGFPIIHNGAEPLDCKEITELIWVVSGKNQGCYDYFMNWLAQMVQHPAVKTGTAVVLKSKQGAGKGTIVQIMRRIMGDYCTETSDPQLNIFGTHGNSHIGKILVSIDEVDNSDTCKILGKLKNIITSDKCVYNEKGLKQVEVNNMCRFIFTTNKPIPINLEQGDRRYCLIESCNDYCLKGGFWNDYYKNVVNNPGKIKAFYNMLMARDISKVDWMQFPDTEFKKDIVKVSLHPIVFWFDYYIHKEVNREFKVGMSILYDSYMEYCNGHNIKGCANVNAFGLIFKNQIDLVKCKIDKVKEGSMKLLINREKVFEWLKANDFTIYESLSPFNDEDGNKKK